MFGGVESSLVSISEEEDGDLSFWEANARSASEFFGLERSACERARVRHLFIVSFGLISAINKKTYFNAVKYPYFTSNSSRNFSSAATPGNSLIESRL